eukprot:gb/GECH01014234.1/.p1 GENE.gb/GECH01014234.1/~~gb/GECH01014234.1/.p1  ORF type:complete len:450 (+),score=122.82 gb/GECH01014234.1/:1-1350(+)
MKRINQNTYVGRANHLKTRNQSRLNQTSLNNNHKLFTFQKNFSTISKDLNFYSTHSVNQTSFQNVKTNYLQYRSYAKKKKSSSEPPQEDESGKSNALSHALKDIEKQYGKGAVMRMGDKSVHLDPSQTYSTGSLGIDLALGIGGLPRGRIIEIYGPEMSGKTTFALQVLAQAQKAGGTCVFLDAEHALSIDYAEKLGIDTDKLYLSQPDDGEQALEIADTLVRSGGVDVIVVDSVAALTPKTELAGDMNDQQIGLQARLMSKALRKLTGSLSKSNTMMIFINQIRHKIGVMFGSPEVTTGGNALKFYSSVRLEVRKTGAIKRGETVIGNQVRIKVTKNKLAPPFATAEVDLEYGKGTSKCAELIDLGVKYGVVQKAGAWFSYNGKQLGQGRDNAKQLLMSDESLANEIEEKIRSHLGENMQQQEQKDSSEGFNEDNETVIEPDDENEES